ncbi:2-oxoacid:acceptor oxidoreductase family protein [Candidatus Bathyarchaeota archaeon]|nr:2-oxoacid:acceptor oxidoreductase family protein [Candidatus Bathyarchaeota archaeon]
MTRKEIRIAGFGGQGVITAGYVLANAAAIYDDQYALMNQSYGPEARGGSCKADVIVSGEPIDYPKASSVDFLVTLSIDAYNAFIKSVRPGGAVIFEESLVEVPEGERVRGIRYIPVPAIEAAQQLGNPLAANMVVLGAVQAVTGVVSLEALKSSVEDRFPRFRDLNLKAVDRGVELAGRPL